MSTHRRLSWVIMVAAIGAAGSVALAAPAVIDAEAQRALRAMADYHKSLDAMRFEVAIEHRRETAAGVDVTETVYDYALARPNRFALRCATDTEPRRGQVVADGEKLHVLVERLGKFTVDDNPEALSDLAGNRMAAYVSYGTSRIVALLAADDPYAALLEGIDSATHIGTVKIDDAEHDRVQLKGNATTSVLVIARGDQPQLKRIELDMSRAEAAAKAAGQQLKLSTTIHLRQFDGEAELDAAAFAFKAPDGASKVASFFRAPAPVAARTEGPGGGGGEGGHPLVGQAAPNFTLDTLDGGKVVLEAHRDKDVVILDFWATWCGPCVRALPILTDVAEQYKHRGVVFYAVNQKEPKERIEAFLKKQGLEMSVLLDDGAVAREYGVRGIPQTVIIGADGQVKHVHVGFAPNLKAQLTAELDALVGAAE